MATCLAAASRALCRHLSNTKWFNIEKLYTDKNHQAAAGPLHYASSVTDSYSQGTSLNSDKINKIVTDTLSKGLLPVDTHGIYVVLTSADVKVQGFCSSWYVIYIIAKINKILGLYILEVGQMTTLMLERSTGWYQNWRPTASP